MRARLTELDPSFVAEFGETGPDVVVPAWVHTPELLQRFVAGQVASGVDPARIRLPTAEERAAALHDAAINPATGVQEFGLWSSIKTLFGRGEQPSRAPAPPAAPPQIDPIPITGRRATERLGPPPGIERIAAYDPAAPQFRPTPAMPRLHPTWRVDPPNPFYNQEVFDAFKDLATEWEGDGSKKYRAPEGKITGGYGRVYPKDTIQNVGNSVSSEEAEYNLMQDYRTWAGTAHCVITRDLEPHQRAVMLSLIHNIGPSAFSDPNHKMLQALNRGDDVAMEKEFREWRKHYSPEAKAKVVSRGLENRRDDEMNVYFGRPRRNDY